MQLDRPQSLLGWHRARCVLATLVILGGGSMTGASEQPAGPAALAGVWALQESSGDLPEQAVRAFDGSAVATATIEIRAADDAVTVRRLTPHAMLLRVLLLNAGEPGAAAPQGAVLTAPAQWQDQTLAARGDIAVKQGFLKRRVPYDEEWQLGEGERTLTVTLRVNTPLGVKRRTQVFIRTDGQKILGSK